jgi:hypothetical protein
MGRSAGEAFPLPEGEEPRRRERVEELLLMRQQAWAAEAFARPSWRWKTSSDPAPFRPRRSATSALQPAERAAPGRRPTLSSLLWTAVGAPFRRSHRTPATQVSGTAPTRLPHPALIITQTAEQHLPAPERVVRHPATALAPRTVSAAPLDLTTRPNRLRDGSSKMTQAGPQRRNVSAAPLEFRRSAPPVSSHEATPASRAPPQPGAPVIDVDALSRDVISRIEKRLRIERERHGRI